MADDRTAPQYKLRMPEALHERLKAAAEKNNRSMNAEIIARIEHTFDPADLSSAELSAAKVLLAEIAKSRNIMNDAVQNILEVQKKFARIATPNEAKDVD